MISLPRKKQLETRPVALKRTATIGVIGSKGGVGATTFAVNLSAGLTADRGSSSAVTLIDANLQQPDAAVLLAYDPPHTMVELLRRVDNIEPQIAHACCAPVPTFPSLRLLTPPPNGNAAARNNLSELSSCLPALQGHFERLVIDLPKHLDRHLVTLIDRCDVLLLVVEPTLASLAGTTRWLSIFDQLGYGPERILIVANRVGGKSKLIEEQLFKTFAHKSISSIPNTFSMAEASAVSGVPLIVSHPKDGYAKAIKHAISKIETALSDTIPNGEEIAPHV